ncbi:Uncharacterized protein HZ326_15616 [Fusarium oxysporum f. sp. albedinis]|nr:Uncharacterized protein HZ326_15616 [Fusarium oxysporum f. sp. albedinis]
MQYRPSSKDPGHNLPANPFFVNGVSSVVFQVGFLELLQAVSTAVKLVVQCSLLVNSPRSSRSTTNLRHLHEPLTFIA